MKYKRREDAFTIIELLVAATIFVSLLGLVTVAFGRISNGGKKGLQVLELHTRADAILRTMNEDLRKIPNIAALHLKPATATEAGSFTFMNMVNDTHPSVTNRGETLPDYNPFARGHGQHYRLTDMIWIRWEWTPGIFKRGRSRINPNEDTNSQWGSGSIRRPATATNDYIYEVLLDGSYPRGIQGNGIPPQVQRHFDFFEGSGSINTINATTGESAAKAGDKLAVYKVVGGNFVNQGRQWHSELFDQNAAPWRIRNEQFQGGDWRHQYTTLECGNQDKLSDANAYAVRNLDGKTVNKDRLNLLGADDTDVNGKLLYPSQMKIAFHGMQYLDLELVRRNGRVVTEGDDTNRLGDSASLDISGIEPDSADGIGNRPSHVRVSFLLHSIPAKERDELDVDADGNSDELLMVAVADLVESEMHPTRLEKIHAYKRHALKLGHTAIYFNQSVQLGY